MESLPIRRTHREDRQKRKKASRRRKSIPRQKTRHRHSTETRRINVHGHGGLRSGLRMRVRFASRARRCACLSIGGSFLPRRTRCNGPDGYGAALLCGIRKTRARKRDDSDSRRNISSGAPTEICRLLALYPVCPVYSDIGIHRIASI